MAADKDEWQVQITFHRRTVVRYNVNAVDDEDAILQARELASEARLSPPANGKVIEDRIVTDTYHARLIEK